MQTLADTQHAPLFGAPAVARRPCGAVRVSGPERLAFLHTLLSQDLENAPVDSVADFLFLDAKGNARVEGRAVIGEQDVVCVVHPEVASDFAAALEGSKFLMQVQAEDESQRWALASVRGTGLEVTAAPDEPMRARRHGDGILIRDRSHGVDVLGPPDWVDERIGALGLDSATAEHWEAWRIAHGLPAWGSEITAGRRPQELGLLPTHVHLRKGCYPGQESIAKTYNLGRPRRALVVVELDHPVAAGDELVAGQRAAVVTSSAPLGERTVAMALCPLESDGTLPGIDGGRIVRRVGEDLAQPGA